MFPCPGRTHSQEEQRNKSGHKRREKGKQTDAANSTSTAVLVPQLCRYVPAVSAGNIATTGTNPHTAGTAFVPDWMYTFVPDWLYTFVPSDYTGTKAGNRHYTGTAGGHVLIVARVFSCHIV